MKRKMTMKLPDGRTITHEMDDEGATIHKNILQMQNQPPDAKTSYMELLKKKQGGQGNAPAMMGRGGDDRLAHVNGYEDLMLRLMGGSGSTNPRTGMKEYAMFRKPIYGNEVWTEPTQQLPYEGVGIIPDAPIAPATPQAGPVYLNTYGGVSNPMLTPELTQTAPPVYNQGSVPQTAPTNILGLTPGVIATPDDFTRFLGGTPEASPIPVTAPPINAPPPPTVPGMGTSTPTIIPPPPVIETQPPSVGNTVNLDPNLKPFSISGSQSSSGLPDTYQDRLLKALFPQLESSIMNMGANYDDYTREALGSYQQMMQNALRKNIPAAIANLANRGIISSTEGQKVLGNVYSSAAEDAANKGYQTAMQSAFLKANMPTVLSQIAQLGQGTRSNQFSYQEDPTVMQRSLIDLLRSMQ